MYIVYNLILILLVLILSPFWILLLLSGSKYRAGFFQKAGFFSSELSNTLKSLSSKPVWFHAVSVGETLAVIDLVKEFNRRYPHINIVFSTVTFTGQEIAKKRLGDIATVIYFPFDLGFITSKFIDLISPALVVIVETEIWPNFAYNLKRKSISLMLINGRLSPKSFKNYKMLKPLIAVVLDCFTCFLMQAGVDADRVLAMGADESRVKVTGNLKYDIKPKFSVDDIQKLKQELCITENDKLLIAGSTHSGEEKMILNTYLSLSDKQDNLKLILVPRHPERYEEVISLLDSNNIKFGRRTNRNTFKDAPVFLLDTMGELSGFYSIAKVAFIGGSLIPKGGHNPLEPAVYSVPVLVGPHTFNFLDITNYMVEAGAAIQIKDENELNEVLSDLLNNNQTYEKAQKACLKVFEDNGGATELVLQTIAELIKL